MEYLKLVGKRKTEWDIHTVNKGSPLLHSSDRLLYGKFAKETFRGLVKVRLLLSMSPLDVRGHMPLGFTFKIITYLFTK